MKKPNRIKILKKVEIYEAGETLTLYYDSMYKFPGAVFGISTARAEKALKDGHAIPIT